MISHYKAEKGFRKGMNRILRGFGVLLARIRALPRAGFRLLRPLPRGSHDHQLNWWHDIDPIRVIYQPRLKTHEDLPIAFHSQAAAKAALFLASEILFPRKRIIVFFH